MNISQVTTGDLALLHLVGNQTVIGRVKEKDGVSIVLAHPIELVLMMHPQQPQQGPVVALVPYLSMQGKLPSLDEVSIHLSLVISPRQVPEALERDYLSTTSGLDLRTRLGDPGQAQNGVLRR